MLSSYKLHNPREIDYRCFNVKPLCPLYVSLKETYNEVKEQEQKNQSDSSNNNPSSSNSENSNDTAIGICICGLAICGGLCCIIDSTVESCVQSNLQESKFPYLKTLLFLGAGAVAGYFGGAAIVAQCTLDASFFTGASTVTKVASTMTGAGLTSCLSRFFCSAREIQDEQIDASPTRRPPV